MLYLLAILYLIAVVLQPAEWVPLFNGVPVQELLMLFAVMTMFFTHFERTKEVFTSNPSIFFLAYIFASIVSCAFMGQAYALNQVGSVLFEFYLGFLLVAVGLNSIKKFRSAISITALSGLIVAYLCIKLAETGQGVGAGLGVDLQELNWRGDVQWIGAFGGGNTTAQLLLLLGGLAFGLSFKEKSMLKRLFFLAVTFYIGYAFLLTNSRGGFLAMLAMLGFYAWTKSGIRLKYFLPLGIVAVATVFVLKPQAEGRGIGESSTPERVELFHHGLQMVKSNPIIGVGYGQFGNNNPIRKTAHNIYLVTVAETGLFGFVMFVLMYFAPIRDLMRNKFQLAEEALEHRTSIPIIYALLGFATTAFFLSSRHELPYMLLALAVAHLMNQGSKFELKMSEFKYILIGIVLVLGAIYILIQLFFAIYR